jgi:nucleoside phosphorylase
MVGWHQGKLLAGQEWKKEMRSHLNEAQVVLLLLSSDYFASDTCMDEMRQALQLRQPGKVEVIPLLIRPSNYDLYPSLEQLSTIPHSKEPLSSGKRDDNLSLAARELRAMLAKLQGAGPSAQSPSPSPSSPSAQAGPNQQNVHFNGPAQGVVIGERNTVHNYYGNQQAAQQNLPLQKAPECDVLLVTATYTEATAVLALCKQETGQDSFKPLFIDNNAYFDIGTIGGARTLMVQSEMGASGASGATLVVQDAIAALKPASIIMVGIAFGTRPEKQRIGDILVARQLTDYEPQRVGPHSKIPRGARADASPRLLSQFNIGRHAWGGAPVHFGLVLSGAKLVDNAAFVRSLLRIEPEAIGGEMEGAGLYAVAYRQRVDWLLVKAICDWGADKSEGAEGMSKDEAQELAARNAAAYVLHVIKQGGLAR